MSMKKNKGLARKNRRKFVSKGRAAAPVRALKMKIKKGDTVVITSGKDKGKQGEVLRVIPKENRIVVDNIAMVKRHFRKAGRGQSGRIAERPASIHASNAMLLDPSSKKPTRVGRRMEGEKRVRVAKKSDSVVK